LPWAGMTRAFGAGLLDCADGIAGKSEADFPGGNDSRKGNDNGKGNSRSFAALRMTSLWGWSQKGKSNDNSKRNSRSFALLRMTSLWGWSQKGKSNDNSKRNSRSFALLRMTNLWGWSQKGKSNFKCKSKSNCKNRCKGMGRLAFAVFHLCRKCWAKIGHSPPIFAGKENVQGVARIAFPECLKHYPE